MNPFQAIGNFLFGGNKKKREDEEQARPQVTVKQPSAITSPNRPPAGVQMPSSLMLPQAQPVMPSLGGVQTPQPKPVAPKPAPEPIKKPVPQRPVTDLNLPGQRYNPALDLTPKKPVAPVVQAPKSPEPNIAQKIFAGFQQGLGRVADTAVQGGSTIQMLGTQVNPFINEEQRAKKIQQDMASAEAIRNTINSWRDINGNSIQGNRDVDESARRIATGQGDAQDAAAVAGRGLDVAGTTTMFINPARTFSGAAATAGAPTVQALKQLAPAVAKEAVLYGGLEGTQASAENYGETGDLMEALRQFAPNFAIGASGQIGLEGAAFAGGRAIRGVAGRTPASVDNALRLIEEPRPVIEPPEFVPREPDVPLRGTLSEDPLTPIATNPNLKPPAITSPNRPAPGTPPVEAGIARAELTTPQPSVELNAPQPQLPNKIRTPDEEVAAAQKAIDEAATEAPVQPAPAVVDQPQLPNDVEARAIAEAATPVNAEAVAADAARQAENVAPTEAIAGELGTITRRAATEGKLTNDTDAQVVANDVGLAIEKAADDIGSNWEEINKKVQAAWSKGIKDYKEAGLTPEEFDVAQKAAAELSLLRQRIDPALISEGQVGQFYSPRQTPDTEFTQDLVNELKRDKQNGLRDNELDLSTKPYIDAIRRYSNAPEAMSASLIDSLENKVVKDALGNENIVPTGVKVPDEVKAAFKEDLRPYIKAQDDALRAADANDPKGIDAAIKAGDKAIDDALTKMASKLPKDTQEARDAIGNLIAERRAYMQSTARTNMFLNVVNRLFDQTQKGIVNFTDQATPLVNRVSAKMFKGLDNDKPGIATDRISQGLAKKYAKGTLLNQQNRNFSTNVRLAGANARNPLTKALAKADAAYRSAGTYLTSLGDLSTNAVKATNLAILGKARAEGIKTAPELEAYLVKNLQTPEYLDIYRNMSNNYAGYIGMPQTLTSTGVKGGKISEFMSKIDNFTKNALDSTPLPDRVKQELNDLIMPAITGFAGATSRVAAKQLNALALGIPNIRRGLKIAASDSPNAKAIGQMMVTRSIIDAVAAGGVGAAGMLLGATGHWTGGYPEDPNERARWEKEGITPNAFSFDVDGKTVYIQPGRILGVLALPMVLPAVVSNAVANGTDPQDAVSEVVSGTIGQFNENLGADALISHIGDIDSVLNNKQDSAQAKKNLLNMLGYSISNVVPASGLQNNIAAATDPFKRETNNVVDVVKNRNPLTRQTLDTRKDNLGNPIENNSRLSLGSAAITVGDGQGNQSPVSEDGTANVDAEINRLAKAKFEVMPARDVKNSNSQNDAKVLLGSSLYQNADDETKADYLKKTLLGTDTKDINKSLSDDERSSLIQHKLQSEEQRKKWLEDNTNAAGYYAAKYDNSKANGTLTSDDDNLQNKSGAKYQMLRAQVNEQFGADQALKQLYDDTSESEWRAMIDPESEDYDPDTAGRLMQYDEARTGAGVSGKSSDTSKPKYTQKTGGSGRKGVGSGGKFAFASLPGSLIGNSASGGSKGYADDAPTFKPIADLKAPEPKEIPKGRTISIKRGRQI